VRVLSEWDDTTYGVMASADGDRKMADRISDFPKEALADVCRQYQVKELSVFGSVLRDDFRADSDIDLLVEFEPQARVGFLTLTRLGRDLSALLKRPVDVIPKGGLKPQIRAEVLAHAEVLFAA